MPPRSTASYDLNFVPTLIGVSSADGKTPVAIEVDPNTGALLTSDEGTASTSFATRIDNFTAASVLYVGKAPIATATSVAGWQIQKIDKTTGIVISWADGNANFDNIWDNRVGLSYS